MIDWLSDSNIWLRIAEPDHPMYAAAENAVSTILTAGGDVHLVPQVVTEYWRVGTAPLGSGTGFGWEPARAYREIQQLEALFPMRRDVPEVYERWKQIVVTENVVNRSVFDARLVAAMMVHDLTHILTFNVRHFKRYERLGITVVHPDDL